MPDAACQATECAAGRVLVWDVEGIPDAGFGSTVLWRSFEKDGDSGCTVVSMPRFVEERSDELKSRYLAWMHDLGEATVDGRTVSDHMLIRPGLSYWWMAAPAQKYSISANSLIPDAIKLLALETLLADESVWAVVLASTNAKLAECLAAYCHRTGRCFEWRRPEQVSQMRVGRRIAYARLPRGLRALLSFCKYCVSRMPRGMHKPRERPATGGISFFDVLVHLDMRAIPSGRFASNYWGPLVDKLFDGGVATNWFHFFYPHPAIPSFAAADRLVRKFRQSSGQQQFHGLIDSFPSVAVFFRACRDYLSLRRMTRLLDDIAPRICPERSALDLWPLHKDEWLESVAGPNALMECLRLGMFEVMLARLPRQRAGIYISENQPWELSLIHAWRQHGHGRLIAVPHTTVRYWDLRYFYDPRSYACKDASGLPLPDCYAVNGPVAQAALLDGGCPAPLVVEVEALRFMHLGRVQNESGSRGDTQRILICGDFLSITNDRIFDWLARLNRDLPKGTSFIFKPHPAFPYDVPSAIKSRLALHVDERPIGDLLPDCDVVIASAITSAAVDAYCAGKRVIQVADSRRLNANALRGLDGTYLAMTPEDLSAALQDTVARAFDGTKPYFLLDPNLSAWQRLLGIGQCVGNLQPHPELDGPDAGAR